MTSYPHYYERLRADVHDRYGAVAPRILDDVFDLAEREHAGEYRKSGDPYITHPVEVATLIASWGLPLALVCAALIHDVPPRSLEDWTEQGKVAEELAAVVRAAMGLDDIRFPKEHELLADVPAEVLVLKIADRLHNARTWSFVPRPRAEEKARETLDLYAPVARKLGLGRAAAELASLSATTLGSDMRTPQVPITPGPPDSPANQQVAGASGRLLGRAVMLLPPAQRLRYLEEWSAELLAMPNSGGRLRMACGLHYSALRLRALSQR